MNPKVEISSLLFSKLKNEQNSFTKYDIEAALDEVENTETEVKLKFKFALLSNPTNTKLMVEGLATVNGNQSETSKLLTPDEKNIPLVVNMIYQDVFPLFYIISKSMQIPCPAYQLSKISQSQQIVSEAISPVIEDKVAEPAIEDKVAEPATSTSTDEPTNIAETQPNEQTETEPPAAQEPIVQEPIVQEPSVSSI
jgi:hypothetical protein